MGPNRDGRAGQAVAGSLVQSRGDLGGDALQLFGIVEQGGQYQHLGTGCCDFAQPVGAFVAGA